MILILPAKLNSLCLAPNSIFLLLYAYWSLSHFPLTSLSSSRSGGAWLFWHVIDRIKRHLEFREVRPPKCQTSAFLSDSLWSPLPRAPENVACFCLDPSPISVGCFSQVWGSVGDWQDQGWEGTVTTQSNMGDKTAMLQSNFYVVVQQKFQKPMLMVLKKYPCLLQSYTKEFWMYISKDQQNQLPLCSTPFHKIHTMHYQSIFTAPLDSLQPLPSNSPRYCHFP